MRIGKLEDWKEKTGCPIKLLRKDHGGKASAANFGAQESQGSLLFFLDADSYVVPDFIEKSLNILQQTKKGAIDYVQQVSNPQINLWTKVSEFERKLLELHPDNFGALFVIKREIFEKYPFTTSLSPQYEIDIRLLRVNLLVFDPTPVVFSDEPEKFSKMLRRKIRWNYGFLEAIQINGFEKKADRFLFTLRILISFIGFFLMVFPFILGMAVSPAFLIFPICAFLVLWVKNVILAIRMELSLHLSFVFTLYQLYVLNLAVILAILRFMLRRPPKW
ncbi:MAG: glycosyltransferase [Candidatus Hodarchaeales archaeon]